MCAPTTRSTLALALSYVAACSGSNAPVASSPAPPPLTSPELGAPPPGPVRQSEPLEPARAATPHCSPADWSARTLAPLLRPGKTANTSRRDQAGAAGLVAAPECTDAPAGATSGSAAAVVMDGVEIQLASVSPAGSSGRGWTGNQCGFHLRLADGTGSEVHLGPEQVPPFNTISARLCVRAVLSQLGNTALNTRPSYSRCRYERAMVSNWKA